jgi:guanylate kinase
VFSKLFLVDGLAGTGKSDLVEYASRSRHTTVISKYTTRNKRELEEATHSDLTFVSEQKFAELSTHDFYIYEYAGKQYGFSRYEVLRALEAYENVFVIVRNRSLSETLRRDFSDIAFVVPIFVYADRGLVVDRLQNDGFDMKAIESRLRRSDLSWDDYLEYPDTSLRVIINNSEKTHFHRKINSLVDEFSLEKIDSSDDLYINPRLSFSLIKPLRGFKKDITRRLRNSPYEKNIFVMMRFRRENFQFYSYIKSEIEKAGFVCVRADASEWNITKNVYNPLAVLYCCKYGIALFDEPEKGQAYNPNVAYELGVMQHQSKQCLILTHDSLPPVPFDIVKDLRKTYSKELDFQRLFSDWLVEIAQES